MSRLVKPNNAGAIYALMVVIGAGSLALLPVALELAVEVTRNADASAALLWAGYVFVFPRFDLASTLTIEFTPRRHLLIALNVYR